MDEPGAANHAKATPLAPGPGQARLEMAVEYLRREWRAGCRAGMAYQTALGSVRRMRSAAATEQIADALSRVIDDLDAYATLSPELRPAALMEIGVAIKRLIPEVARVEGALISARSVPTFEREPAPAIVQENRPDQLPPSLTLPSPAAVLGELHRLSPSEFELTVASLLEARGLTDAQVIGGANDLGVDIRCYDLIGNLVVVQCKRYASHRRITSPMIQHFMAMALHHGANGKMFVTTSEYTAQAIALAQEAGMELIDGNALATLVHESRALACYPDPSVPVVLPDFYADGPAHAAAAARHAWLAQLFPETPVVSGYAQWDSTTTEEVKRAWTDNHARLLALTAEHFRKACALLHVAGWERDRPAIRLLDNQNGPILDYVLMWRQRPTLSRCHRLPAEYTVTAEQVDQFIRFAEANGWGTGPYSTTGLFSAGALLRADHHDFGGATLDGWHVAFSLLPDMHWYSEGKDFIALAQQPGWPKQIWEGTERRGLLRKLFG